MKKYLIPSFVITVLFSCNPSGTTINDPSPEISYDVNGSRHSHTGTQTTTNGGVGVYAIKMPGTPGVINTYYSFSGYTNINSFVSISVITPNDTLRAMNYHIIPQGVGLVMIKVYGDSYQLIDNSDYIDVTITGYQNGVVSGSFSGKVSKIVSLNPNVFQSTTVTGGVIKNVRLIYF